MSYEDRLASIGERVSNIAQPWEVSDNGYIYCGDYYGFGSIQIKPSNGSVVFYGECGIAYGVISEEELLFRRSTDSTKISAAKDGSFQISMNEISLQSGKSQFILEDTSTYLQRTSNNSFNSYLRQAGLFDNNFEIRNFDSIKMIGYSYSENDKNGEPHYMTFEPVQGEITGLTTSPSSSSSAASKAYVDAQIAALKEELTNA